jgi:hypothetical protein
MNRIRQVDNVYQVLITPNFKISPDSSILVGNWQDENLRNFYILEFQSLNDAQYEALKYPDIDWYHLFVNHQHICKRLEMTIKEILADRGFNADLRTKLLRPEELKQTFMDRVANGGERFNLRHHMNDIISFTIVNPWSNNLHNISRALETFREHLDRDDLRLRSKKIVDGKIICLYGFTDIGTVYEIKLIPTLLDQWAQWFNASGYRNEPNANALYEKMMAKQKSLDDGPILL